MKTCSKCGEIKPLAEFSRDKSRKDGLAYVCKACRSADSKAWYAANRERKAATAKAWQKNNRDKMAASSKAWRERHPARAAEVFKGYATRNPEKRRAKDHIFRAVKAGRMQPASAYPCVDCGSDAQEYHHPDYTRPWYVVALCRQCHAGRHTT